MHWLLRLSIPLFLALPALAQTLDIYGGWQQRPCAGGTSTRFYPERIGTQSYLCTPSGNALFAQGTYAAGPQGNAAAKYGTVANADEQTIIRIKSFGFNFLHAYSDANLNPWLRTNKIPVIGIARPGNYGMYASSLFPGLLTQNIKDLANGISPVFTAVNFNGMPDWADLTKFDTMLNYLLVTNTGSDPAGIPGLIASGGVGAEWLMGIAIEDSDQTWGYWNSGDYPYPTQPAGRGSAQGGYVTAIMSPVQQADARRLSLYTSDRTVYTKTSWHDYLVAKYGTIGALNTAWSTSGAYTTFGSSATQVSGESIGTTNGTSFAFTHTLANGGTLSPNTIQILEDGVMIAGDCFHPNIGDACNPTTGTNVGAIWGPTASGGTVTYSTKSVTVSYSGIYKYLASLTCSITGTPSCTGTVADYDDAALGLSVSDKLTVKDSVCCSTGALVETVSTKTGPSGGLYTYTWTNTAGNVGSETWGGGARDLIAKVTVPAGGHVLTVNYQVGGWNAGGTGLMDENGSHSWFGTDAYNLSDANVTCAADMRSWLGALAHTYFSDMRAKMRLAFTGNSITPPLYFGPDSWGTWATTPRQEVLQGAAGVIDVAIMGGSAGYTLTTPSLNYIGQYFNGPFIDGVFLHANQDSPYSANVLPDDYATQALRGAAFYATVQTYLSGITSGGYNPRAGFGWWQYGDNTSEGTNWGLVSVLDNAYDAHESVTGSVTCSAPLAAYTCGGEPGNYGNVITPVKAGNALWLASSGAIKGAVCSGTMCASLK